MQKSSENRRVSMYVRFAPHMHTLVALRCGVIKRAVRSGARPYEQQRYLHGVQPQLPDLIVACQSCWAQLREGRFPTGTSVEVERCSRPVVEVRGSGRLRDVAGRATCARVRGLCEALSEATAFCTRSKRGRLDERGGRKVCVSVCVRVSNRTTQYMCVCV